MEVLVLPLAAPRLLKLFLLKKIRLYVVANYELKLMRLRDNPEVLLLHSNCAIDSGTFIFTCNTSI